MPRAATFEPDEGKYHLVSDLAQLAQLAAGDNIAWARRAQEPHLRDPNIQRVAEWLGAARAVLRDVRHQDTVRHQMHVWLVKKIRTLVFAQQSQHIAAIDISDQIVRVCRAFFETCWKR